MCPASSHHTIIILSCGCRARHYTLSSPARHQSQGGKLIWPGPGLGPGPGDGPDDGPGDGLDDGPGAVEGTGDCDDAGDGPEDYSGDGSG